MAIGIVSDEEFFREFRKSAPKESSHPEESSRPVIETLDKPGRKEGDVNVPDALRQIIGETSVIEGRKAAVKLAEEFGISPSSVSAYANGATSTTTYATPSNSIISHLNKSRERATKRASKVLHSALGSITQEKLDYADAKDLSTIAKDMSVVIKNLEPPKEAVINSESQVPQFVIFAPQFRTESSFDVIDVKE